MLSQIDSSLELQRHGLLIFLVFLKDDQDLISIYHFLIADFIIEAYLKMTKHLGKVANFIIQLYHFPKYY